MRLCEGAAGLLALRVRGCGAAGGGGRLAGVTAHVSLRMMTGEVPRMPPKPVASDAPRKAALVPGN